MATGFNTQTGGGEYRLQFETTNKEYFLLMQETARRCVDHKPITNADRIRAMSDKELAHWINLNAYNDFAYEHCCDAEWRKKPCNNKCVACLVAWLQQPAEEVDHE